MAAILYLIPNTLGQAEQDQNEPLSLIIPQNVQEITARLDYFIAENAKSARALLKLVAYRHPLAIPLQEIQIAALDVNTAASALPALLAPLLAGKDGGLISEAGVPAVADPGSDLVRMAHQHGITVRPLVGPSSLLLAIMASGLNGQRFAFNGYLPTDAMQRGKRLKELETRSRQENQTQLFIETPYRNGPLLDAMIANCQSNTMICIATDLTLPSEIIRTRTAIEWKGALNSGTAQTIHKKPSIFLMLAE